MPGFSAADLTNTTHSSDYANGNGAWVVGNNWINGTISPTVTAGSYTIKAIDYVSKNVAVTDVFISVYNVISASLHVSPSSGPGGVPITFTGDGYSPNDVVTISYYDPAFNSWNYFATATANSSGAIMFNSVIPDLRSSLRAGDYSEETASLSFRSQVNGIVYGYVDYHQYSRGIKRVGDQIASGLYGNGTNLASSISVERGDKLPISGKWFHPGDVIYVKWDGTPIVGTVTSEEWLGISPLNSTIADSSGSFETTITIPDAAAGEHYIAIEDSETRLIIKIFMSRGSLQITPSSGPGGVIVTFMGSGYAPYADVTISYDDTFFGLWTVCGSTTADSAGDMTFTMEMPDLRKSVGAYDSEDTTTISFRTESEDIVHSYADYHQNSRGLKQVGNRIANGLFGNGTDLISSVIVENGDTITVSGRWFHPGDAIYVRWDGRAVVGTVTSSEWQNAQIIGTSIAGSTGSFTATATIPAADGGMHYLAVKDSETRVIVQVGVPNSTNPEPTPTPSEEPTPTPTPAPTETLPDIELYCSSTTSYSGFTVQIYGAVSFNGVPASGESILLSYSKNGGKSWDDLTLTQTGSNGEFREVWNPSVTGNYLIQAKWEGDSPLNTVSKIVSLAITPYSEQTLFSVASNSTITEFALNSTSKELTFTASGASGTTGYVRVYIPKTLINDISGLKIRVDEKIVTYTSESQEDSWAIFFTYAHSTHKVVIELSAAANRGDETPPDLIIYGAVIAAVIVAVAVATITIKKRRNTPKTDTQTN